MFSLKCGAFKWIQNDTHESPGCRYACKQKFYFLKSKKKAIHRTNKQV